MEEHHDVEPAKIQAAYRRRAGETHPDRGGSSDAYRVPGRPLCVREAATLALLGFYMYRAKGIPITPDGFARLSDVLHVVRPWAMSLEDVERVVAIACRMTWQRFWKVVKVQM